METTLVHGFLDAGKTTYIQECVLSDFFHKYGSTLILCFESGETEYDLRALAEKRTNVACYESGDDVTAFCMENIEKYHPDRIYVEMNCMLKGLAGHFPAAMEVRFSTARVAFSTLPLYMNNLRQFLFDMVSVSDTVTFTGCPSKEALAPYETFFRSVNGKATYLRQDPMGYHEKAFGLPLPWPLDAPEIEISEAAYLIFCLDAMEHPEHYDKKVLTFSFPLEKYEQDGALMFGRMVMTCCMADLKRMGFPSAAPEDSAEGRGGMVLLRARGCVTSDRYGQKSLSLLPLAETPTAQPGTLILR